MEQTPRPLIVLPPEFRFIILGIILLAWLAFWVIPALVKREHVHLAAGTQREYGLGGGAICPRCHRPFPLAMFGPRLGFGTTLARCPYCGHIGRFHRCGLEELREQTDDTRFTGPIK